MSRLLNIVINTSWHADISSNNGTGSGVTLDFHSVNVKQKCNDTAHEESRVAVSNQ